MTINYILLIGLVLAAIATVSTPRVMWSALGLAVVSVILSVLMFRLDSPLAGVFELSVCAGLIPVILLSTVGLTVRLSPDALAARKRQKLKRFALLPVILVVAAVLLLRVHLPVDFPTPPPAAETDVRNVMWNLRHNDLLGQIGHPRSRGVRDCSSCQRSKACLRKPSNCLAPAG